MKSLVVLLTFVALVTAVERVANGTKAEPGDAPYVVQVLVNGEHVCGGFIYSDFWVVTAASCVYGKVASQVSIVAGQVSLIETDPEEQTRFVYEIKIFPSYNHDIKLHDVAMLNLATRISFDPLTGYVSPIAYGPATDTAGYQGAFYGWGALIEGGLVSLHLRTISVTFGSDCRVYGIDQYYEDYMLCAGDSAVDDGAPCAYDEGSPLVQLSGTGDLIVVGIMSKNKGCAPGFWPTIYTEVNKYGVWFNSTAGAQPL